MPVCRHCGSRISKFDKDRCPVCGEINPLEGVSSDTIEITSRIDITPKDYNDFKPKKRSTFLLLACLIGWTGAEFFYLKYKRAGIIWLVINLLVLVGGFLGLFLGAKSLLLGLLIPFGVVYLLSIIMGLAIYFNPSFKDANENLLK